MLTQSIYSATLEKLYRWSNLPVEQIKTLYIYCRKTAILEDCAAHTLSISNIVLYKPVAKYVVMIHISEQVRLNYKQYRYKLCVRHLRVIVQSYGQHTYLPKTMKYSRPDFFCKRNTFVSNFMLLCIKMTI